MGSAKDAKVELLTMAFSELSSKRFKTILKIIDRQHLQARRLKARREISKGKLTNQSNLFIEA